MRLFIVDGSNVVMRCALGGDIAPEPAVKTATNMIYRAAREFEATHLVVALDCPGVPSWRKALYPEYKAGRERDTTPWLQAAGIAWFREGWWVEAVNGWEADDVIATVALRAKPRGAVLVLSGDSDVLPLTSDGIEVVKPLNGGRFATVRDPDVCAMYGLSQAAQLVDYKAMTGESGDNVPGVDGIGPVRAAALLRTYASLEAVIAAGQLNACKHSMQVAAAAETARLALKLVTLVRSVPVVPITPSGCAI